MATRSDRSDGTRSPGSDTPPSTTSQPDTGTDTAVPPAQVDVRPRQIVSDGRARPIILKVKGIRRKRGRKRYSRGTKDLQRLTFGSAKGTYRLLDGLAAGAGTFWRRSRRSARRKKDGLAKDLWTNLARGYRKYSRESGRAPIELARRIRGRRAWKSVKKFWRGVPVPFAFR
jgi:hypothetical protein